METLKDNDKETMCRERNRDERKREREKKKKERKLRDLRKLYGKFSFQLIGVL